MAKRKSPKELMAARNPLARTAVTPIDIYSQAQPPVVAAQPIKQQTTEHKQAARKSEAGKAVSSVSSKQPQKENEPQVPYSTYLNPAVIKQIKLRALERDTKDYRIVQEAIDEYFECHPTM